MKRKNIKIGFTLMELLVVITVIAILAILLLPQLTKIKPDKNKTMFKKAYSIVEKTVAELVNDETLYPYDPTKLGFVNDIEVQIPGEADGKMAKGENKFVLLFLDKLNVAQFENDKDKDNPVKFTTTDGMGWIIPVQKFTRGSELEITVDVNGFDKEPNTDDDSYPKKDRFKIDIKFDGKVTVKGELEKKFLTSHELREED